MTIRKVLLRVAALIVLAQIPLLAQSPVDALVAQKEYKKLSELLKTVTVIEENAPLPDHPKEFDLLVIEDDYGTKTLHEYSKGSWHEKIDTPIIKILSGQGSSMAFMLNAKPGSKGYDKYTKESFSEYTTDKAHIGIEFLPSEFKAEAIKNQINHFVSTNSIPTDGVISVQILPADARKCMVIVTYRH